MTKRSSELTAQQLAEMSREELNALWLQIRLELEKKDPNSLTPNEKNHLILAIFYTTRQ